MRNLWVWCVWSGIDWGKGKGDLLLVSSPFMGTGDGGGKCFRLNEHALAFVRADLPSPFS